MYAGNHVEIMHAHAFYASAIYALRSDVTTPTHCVDQRTLAWVRAVRPNPPNPPPPPPQPTGLILRTLRVLAGTESLVEYVYVSKRVCNCRVWEF